MSLTLTNVVRSIDRKIFGDCTISFMKDWGTVYCELPITNNTIKAEFHYSFNIEGNEVTFDDWSFFDVLEDCPEVIDALEFYGFNVTK